MTNPQYNNLDKLLSAYRYFLIDQFGVLHNGQTPYPGALNALEKINASGAQTIIISNSGKRSAVNEQRMTKLGFHRHCYHQIITSGETAWHRTMAMISNGTIAPGSFCYLLANDEDTSAIDGLDLQLTNNIEDANVILLSGLRGYTQPLEYFINLLKPALSNNTLCICTNPDKWALIGDKRVFGPGRVAEEFEQLGGNVMWIGKPYPEIYRYCLSRFEGFDSSLEDGVCCIGDSIEHDICGGHNLGLDTLLVRTGIYQQLTDDDLTKLYAQYGATPDHLMASFTSE